MNLLVIQRYTEAILSIINFAIVPILIAVAVLYFIVGVYKYFIKGATNEADRIKGRDFILWSIVGFVIIMSVWGLVWLVSGTLLGPAGPGVNMLAPRPPTI